MVEAFEEFDAHVLVSDPDGQDWADGLGAEQAGSMLSGFNASDWTKLEVACHDRPANWRRCVAQVLTPSVGISAQKLLLKLVHDKSETVAFDALCSVSFYCGINAGSDAVFVDNSIADADFLARARRDAALPNGIETISRCCDPRFGKRFRLLASILKQGQ